MPNRQRPWQSRDDAPDARAGIPVPRPIADPPTFTPRERQIIRLIAEGLTTGQIAVRLGIAAGTVRAHRRAIKIKLGDGDISTLTRLAIRQGWVSA